MLPAQYLLKLSVSLALVWLFYQFVLRRLTFYRSNRWYLLVYTVLCFFIPFINISPVLEKNEWADSTAVSWVPLIGKYGPEDLVSNTAGKFFTIENSISGVLVIGMLVMFIRLVLQLISFNRMKKTATAIPADKVNLFQVDENIIPFSFGNSIFINQHLHTAEELREIIRHEFVHVKQKHSIDIIWGELLCLVNWYNPFAWLLKRSIRQNLEFIADNKVLENGIDKKQYQYLLLKVIGNNQFSIAPKFNFSSLKKRIAMMNKLKTARLHLVRFLFILPLLAVILLSFRKQIGNSTNSKRLYEVTLHDTIPQKERTSAAMESEQKFIYNHPSVKNIRWGYMLPAQDHDASLPGEAGVAIMTIHYKNGKEDMYNLGLVADIQKFKRNFGEVPPVPPPYTRMHEPNNKGYYLDIADDHGNCTVVITNGEKEIDRVLLNSWKEDPEYYENKYGEFLPAPPPHPEVTEVMLHDKMSNGVKEMTTNAGIVEVYLTDGSREKYRLKMPSEKAAFEEKYGMESHPAIIAERPVHEYELNAAQEANRGKIGDHFEINDDNKAIVHLKNGTVEKYDLAKPEEREKFETTYGRIIEINKAGESPTEPVKVITSTDALTTIAPTTITGPGGVLWLNDEGQIISGEEEVLFIITRKTTQQQLEVFSREMKAQGIELKFDNTEFKDGTLVHVDGTAKFKDHKNHFSASGFSRVILSKVKNGDQIYIQVRIDEGKQVS